MSPMHRSPHDIVGIELIKQMIITAIIDQSVGIVNPTDGAVQNDRRAESLLSPDFYSFL